MDADNQSSCFALPAKLPIESGRWLCSELTRWERSDVDRALMGIFE